MDEDYEQLTLSFIDNDLNIDDKKNFIKMLTKSSELREKVIYFDNFEWLSYKTVENVKTLNLENVDEFDMFNQPDEFDESHDLQNDDTFDEENQNEENVLEENLEENLKLSEKSKNYAHKKGISLYYSIVYKICRLLLSFLLT